MAMKFQKGDIIQFCASYYYVCGISHLDYQLILLCSNSGKEFYSSGVYVENLCKLVTSIFRDTF